MKVTGLSGIPNWETIHQEICLLPMKTQLKVTVWVNNQRENMGLTREDDMVDLELNKC